MIRYDRKIRNSVLALISAAAIVIITVVISYFVIYGPSGSVMLGNKNEKALSYANASATTTQGATVFLGDSITELYNLKEYYPDLEACNRGISGDTTEGMLKRLDSNVLAIAPTRLVFLGGTNDIGKRIPTTDIANNIESIIKKTRETLPDCDVFVQSVYPVNPTRKPTFYCKAGVRTNEAVDELNLLLQDVCKKYDCVYIDVNSHLKDESGNLKEQYSVDGLHLTKQGYEKVSSLVMPYLKTSI